MDFGFVRCVRSECETKWRRPQKPCLWSVVILIHFWLLECYCCYLKHGNGITLFLEESQVFVFKLFPAFTWLKEFEHSKNNKSKILVSVEWVVFLSFVYLHLLDISVHTKWWHYLHKIFEDTRARSLHNNRRGNKPLFRVLFAKKSLVKI